MGGVPGQMLAHGSCGALGPEGQQHPKLLWLPPLIQPMWQVLGGPTPLMVLYVLAPMSGVLWGAKCLHVGACSHRGQKALLACVATMSVAAKVAGAN